MHANTQKTAEVPGMALVVGAIHIQRLLIGRPRPVKEGNQPVMKRVEEGGDRVIAEMTLPFARVLGKVIGHRSIGAEKAEKVDGKLRNPGVLSRAKLLDRGGGEGQRWILPEPDWILCRRERVANAREFGMKAFQKPDGSIKIESRWIGFQLGNQSIWRLPTCAGHRMISPRCCVRMIVSVNELSDTYLAKNCSSTPPRTKTPVPSNAISSKVKVISRPRAKVIGPGVLTRRTMGLDLTERRPSICLATCRSFASTYSLRISRRAKAPPSPFVSSSERNVNER